MGKLTVYVDRIESLGQDSEQRIAVLLFRMEAGVYQEWHVPLHFLPDGTQEGDVLKLTFEPDQQEREALKERVENRMADLFDDAESEEDSGSPKA